MIVTALGLAPGLAHATLIWRPDETTDGQGHLFIVLRRLDKSRELETSGIVLGTIKDEKRRRTRHYLLLDPKGEVRRASVVTNDLGEGAETLDGSERVKRLSLASPALQAWLKHEREFYFEWRHRKDVKPVEKTGS